MIDVTRSELLQALHISRWATEIAAHSPYDDWPSLRAAAAAAASPLAPDEIAEAVAAHPRIGDAPNGDTAADRFSRAEQQAPDVDDQHLAKALAEGNATYEQRFGRVFLIRASGRSRAEIVAELDRRLLLDDETELGIVGDELREIALLRLEHRFGTPA